MSSLAGNYCGNSQLWSPRIGDKVLRILTVQFCFVSTFAPHPAPSCFLCVFFFIIVFLWEFLLCLFSTLTSSSNPFQIHSTYLHSQFLCVFPLPHLKNWSSTICAARILLEVWPSLEAVQLSRGHTFKSDFSWPLWVDIGCSRLLTYRWDFMPLPPCWIWSAWSSGIVQLFVVLTFALKVWFPCSAVSLGNL